MKIKTLNLLLCLIAVTSSMLISCSEDLGFGNKIEQDEAKLVSVAKQIYQNQGSSVCLPNSNADKTNASRSSFSYLADLEPLWDETFSYQQGNETIVIVPLKCDEDIRSTLSITDGEETSYQFAKVFSRMIVKPSEGENGIYVLSYMPESSYASTFDDIEQEMRYNPTELDFTGLIVSSRLNGEVMKGFLYNEGVLGHYFAPATTECHDYNCTENHNHNHEHKGLSLSFNLQNANQSRSSIYSTRSEDGGDNENSENMGEICKICNQIKEKCTCICWDCGLHINHCICEKCRYCDQKKIYCNCDKPEGEKKEKCLLCGAFYELAGDHNCGSTICPVCKSTKCICNSGANEPCKYCGNDPCTCGQTQEFCEICRRSLRYCVCCSDCKKYPCECPPICENCGELLENCICETNIYPIDYDLHDNDMLVGIIEECVETNICCAMAVLEMAYRIYDGTEMNQQTFAQYYTQFNYMSPNEETILERNDNFMTHFFETSSFSTMTAEINSNNVIVVRKNQHYVLVFGLQYDGDVIYADPHEGGIYAVSENYFNGCDAFVIEGINQSRKRTLAQ